MADSWPLDGSQPLHSRTFDITVRWSAEARRWVAHAEIVDLRKSGFVPIAGDLQTAGFLHHMVVDAVVDPSVGVVEKISAAQPRVAFESSALSCGESCRDPLAAIDAAGGSNLGELDDRIRARISGAAGCAHLLSLARMLGATLLRLSESTEAAGIDEWRDGERIFHRTISYDASKSSADEISTIVQLTDLEFRPCPEVVRPLDRLASQSEVRGKATVSRSDLQLVSIDLGLRSRDASTITRQDFTDVSEVVAPALGQPLGRGWRKRVLATGTTAGEPLGAALIDLTAAVLQAVASDTESWPQRVADSAAIVVTGGARDSCYMWRAGGALASALDGET